MKKILLLVLVCFIFSFCKKKQDLEKKEATLEVNFDAASKLITEGDTVRFINSSSHSESEASYSWTFTGGTPAASTEKNPLIKYNNSGIYDVKLVVTTKSKKETLINTKFITVKVPEPIETLDVKFDSQTNSIFEDESVSFVNMTQSSSSSLTYKWTFPGGIPNTSTEKNPTIKYDKSGSYDVKLVVISKSKKDSVTTTNFINVKSSLTKGLLLYYPLNGNANDYSGNNINGVVSPLVNQAVGKGGVGNSAYQFTGNSSSFIQIPSAKLKINTFSYCMWVYLDELPSYGGQYMPFAIGNVGGDQHIQAMNNVIDGNGWAFGGYNNNYQSFFKASQKSLEAKKWYLIVTTRSNNKVSVYVDCNLVGEVSSTNTVLPNYSQYEVIARLGCRYDGTFALKGKIDEFRIYDRALSAEDIARLCEKGPTPSEFQ